MTDKQLSIVEQAVEYNINKLEEVNGQINKVIDELIVLDTGHEAVWCPLRDISLRFKVNPAEEYGEDKIQKFINDFKKLKGVKNND